MLCAITIPPADLRLLNLYYYAVCSRMCMSSVCLVFLSVGDLLVSQAHSLQHLKAIKC